MTTSEIRIAAVEPTVLLREGTDGLEQLVNVTIACGEGGGEAVLEAGLDGELRSFPLGRLPPGEYTHEVFVKEAAGECTAAFVLKCGDKLIDTKEQPWSPPRHWTLHVVQGSHHDVGYTDLASRVLPEQDRWLDEVIEMAEGTRDYPDHEQFRIAVEQTWSIDHYLGHAPPARVERMLALMKSGHVELTALFGNMTAELCGNETTARCLYHAFRIKREHGIPIVSAEHNDIPGFCWGLARILTDAGIKIFCPGLALYYHWGGMGLPSFWDEKAVFGYEDMPGAFWWEGPDGRRILYWYGHQGAGGDCKPAMPGVAERLRVLEDNGFPFDVVRWVVRGGGRDNSPYSDRYVETIRDWNSKWVYPRLLSSTNARFYEQFMQGLDVELPVHRCELPGQDYPAGATSTARATAVNRRNHSAVPAAETLAAVASRLSDYEYQDEELFEAHEHVLWHDEHTWGHHFPCGPTAETSELEKALHAHTAATLAHDVSNKAMARIADRVRIEQGDIHLVVFNPLGRRRTDIVSAPLREIDNCGSTMAPMPPEDRTPEEGEYVRGVILTDRWHVNPPPEIVEGKFDLVDLASGAEVPYQVVEIGSPMEAVPYAAQRMGIGAGGRRYGGFEVPLGLKRDLRFLAKDVPAAGYRTYRFVPRDDSPSFEGTCSASGTVVENEFYRLEVDPRTGFVVSLKDKESGREFVDTDAWHPFGSVIVRDPAGKEQVSECSAVVPGESGPVCASLRMTFAVEGHPRIEQTVTIYAGVKRIDFAAHVVKDPTPLLEAHLAFPFKAPGSTFRYESPLAVVDPVTDLFPGAYFDRLVVQNWVRMGGDECTVLWSSLDCPTVSPGRLWPGRISPAHSSVLAEEVGHPLAPAAETGGGTIYSCLFANNFGTNFSVSQCGATLFRYTFKLLEGDASDTDAAVFGWDAVTPLNQVLTKHPGPRNLDPAGSVLEIDDPSVQLLALKAAEDGRGMILRLWNVSDRDVSSRVRLPQVTLDRVIMTNVVEEDAHDLPNSDGNEFQLDIGPQHMVTLRLVPVATRSTE